MKIAVWGLGNHALKNIIPALERSKNLKLYGVFSRNIDTVDKCCDEFDCITWESEEEMFSDDNLDVIYSATPPALRYYQAKKTLYSKKHFWAEKPLLMNLKQTEEIIKISKEENLTICEGFMFLYHPQYKWIKNYLQKYDASQINSVNINFTIPKSENESYRYNKNLGGSAFFDIGIYLIKVIDDLFLDKEIKIEHSRVTKDKTSGIDLKGNLVLSLLSGPNFYLTWGMELPYRNEIDIMTFENSIFSERIFSKKEDFDAQIFKRDIHGDKKLIKIGKSNHFLEMFDDFYEATLSEEKAEDHRNSIISLHSLAEKIYSQI
mgnify:CR=1 FL=1|tara:strand:+ start:16428 stop:17387 length:960 start_codon:yes stop_codon:yes gene_type:complete